MNSSSDAAESIVRMSLNGLEVAAKISGAGAKNVSVLIYTILKNKKQTKGKTRLVNMLKSGKELKVFSVRKGDLKVFSKEASRYGVLFSALVDRKLASPDGMVDIMVRAEDAAKINRIVDRFNISSFDCAKVTSEINKTKGSNDKGVVVKSIDDKLIDDILSKPINKEKSEVLNPNIAKTEKSPLSEHLYKNKSLVKEGTKTDKPSVKLEIENIRKDLKKKSVLSKKTKNKSKKKVGITK